MQTSKNMTNQQLAKLLEAVAAAYEVKGENQFRIAAYQNAAAVIEHASSEVKDIWEAGQLTALPGVGKNIASHLDELFRTGKVKHFNQLFKSLPPAMFALLDVPGIGPKTAYKLCRNLAITRAQGALKKLQRLAAQGKIRQLEGFGPQSEAEILKAVQQYQRREQRMLLPSAQRLAQEIIAFLQQSPAVIKAEPLGSLRRQAATIGDIDIAVATNQPKKVSQYFTQFPQIKKITDKGSKKISAVLHSGHQVDLRFQAKESFGSLLQYFTGSKQHNISLRVLAQQKKLSLSEYGIKKLRSNRLIKFAHEKAFYRFLGLDWIPPELRENRGEIEAAQAHQLPQLVKLNQIKGDLHVHSNFDIKTSHDIGQSSILALLKQAQKLGYQYLGLADHNPSISHHNPKQIIDAVKRRKAKIEKIKYSHGKDMKIRVLNLLEVDIKPNGSLAVPDQALEQLDFAIVAVHSSFRQNRAEATKRVLTALEHPQVKILAHPAARKLNSREAINLDWDQLFDFCSRHNKILEINSWPDRLDLPDILVRQAIKSDVKLVINSDAHAFSHLELISFGVAVARRGWAESKHIVNTLPWKKFKAILNLDN